MKQLKPPKNVFATEIGGDVMRPTHPLCLGHGFHTDAEPQGEGLEKPITVIYEDIAQRLHGWLKDGEVCAVKHSRMPQALRWRGRFGQFHDLVQKFKDQNYPWTVLSALESNIRRTGRRTFVDGDPSLFDVQIGSIHCTSQCGWGNRRTPRDFVEAYRAIYPQLTAPRKSLGHMMFYAEGPGWTEAYIDVMNDAAEANTTVGIFVVNALRRKTQPWARKDLYHPEDGFAILQRWSLPYLRQQKHLRLSLDWDAHEERDIAGLTQENLDLLMSILKEEDIYDLFMV